MPNITNIDEAIALLSHKYFIKGYCKKTQQFSECIKFFMMQVIDDNQENVIQQAKDITAELKFKVSVFQLSDNVYSLENYCWTDNQGDNQGNFPIYTT